MWLPQDERRLLSYYHHTREQIGKESNYSLEDLVLALYCKNSKEVSDHIKRESQRKTIENLNENVQKYLDESNRIRSANEALKQRGLIALTPQMDSQLITLSLTAQGDDLGRKYSSISGTAWAWSNEHKVWIVLSAITGFAILIVTILVAIFKD
jgi:hypothetical protein